MPRFYETTLSITNLHNLSISTHVNRSRIYETATPSAPSGTAQSELFNGSWGLLKSSGSSYNTADAEANQEMVDILRRRKKVKRKRGVGF